LIIQIPPFSRKWPILPGKYIQVLSIIHKMADYFAFPLLLAYIPETVMNCDDDYVNKPER
jgi:hypothetical protein